MAIKMLNVEKSAFIDKSIDIYTKNKLGEYSKFLEKNPIFVTYFPINEIATTTDIGSGNIDKLFGPMSPLRFNRISNLPVYGVPAELKPDYTLDEEMGSNTSLDLSDIIFLPNTIKPQPYDVMIISIGDSQLLFRCTNFRFNTVQSNDYYTADFTLYSTDNRNEDIESRLLSSQIIKRYICVFENIGTQYNPFIEEEDVDKINSLVRIVEVLKKDYFAKFYDTLSNSFLLRKNEFDYRCKVYVENERIKIPGHPSPVIDKIIKHHVTFEERLYDPYLERFITNTEILESDDASYSLALTPNDVLPSDFDSLYKRSLLGAIEEHSITLLERFMYFYQCNTVKEYSPFKVYGIPCNTVYLVQMEKGNFYTDKEILMREYNVACSKIDDIFYGYDQDMYLEEEIKEMKKLRDNTKLSILSIKHSDEVKVINQIISNFAMQMEKIPTKEDVKVVKAVQDFQSWYNSIIDTREITQEKYIELSDHYEAFMQKIYTVPFDILDTYIKFNNNIFGDMVKDLPFKPIVREPVKHMINTWVRELKEDSDNE